MISIRVVNWLSVNR